MGVGRGLASQRDFRLWWAGSLVSGIGSARSLSAIVGPSLAALAISAWLPLPC
jgi:hypothetical protein